jgi:hypothetical protein
VPTPTTPARGIWPSGPSTMQCPEPAALCGQPPSWTAFRRRRRVRGGAAAGCSDARDVGQGDNVEERRTGQILGGGVLVDGTVCPSCAAAAGVADSAWFHDTSGGSCSSPSAATRPRALRPPLPAATITDATGNRPPAASRPSTTAAKTAGFGTRLIGISACPDRKASEVTSRPPPGTRAGQHLYGNVEQSLRLGRCRLLPNSRRPGWRALLCNRGGRRGRVTAPPARTTGRAQRPTGRRIGPRWQQHDQRNRHLGQGGSPVVAVRFASVTQLLGGRENRAALRREHPGTGDQHLVGPDGKFRRAPAGAAAGVGPQLGAVFKDVPVVAGEHHDAAEDAARSSSCGSPDTSSDRHPGSSDWRPALSESSTALRTTPTTGSPSGPTACSSSAPRSFPSEPPIPDLRTSTAPPDGQNPWDPKAGFSPAAVPGRRAAAKRLARLK